MGISDIQLEAIEFSIEELREVSRLIERIISKNEDATVEELRHLGILWELVLTAGKELKALRKMKFESFTQRTSAGSYNAIV